MPATGTHEGPLSARAPRLAPWRAFVRANAPVSRRLDEDLRQEHGLSLQEYGALLILAESPDRRLRMGRLAESLTLSKSGATRLIDRLVEDGVRSRLSCSTHARGAQAPLPTPGSLPPPTPAGPSAPRRRGGGARADIRLRRQAPGGVRRPPPRGAPRGEGRLGARAARQLRGTPRGSPLPDSRRDPAGRTDLRRRRTRLGR